MSENTEENVVCSSEVELTKTVTEADTSQNDSISSQDPDESLISDTNEPSSLPPNELVENTVQTSETETTSVETNTDVTPSKVKSRELKSLLDAAKEANLDTNIVHKRKSEPAVISGNSLSKRRNSTSSTDSYQSAGKRSMRSQNPEFLQKHKKFLEIVTGVQSEDGEVEHIFENEDDDWVQTSYKQKISTSGTIAQKIHASGSKTPVRSRSKTPVRSRSKTPVRAKTPVRPKTPVLPKTPKRKRDSVTEFNSGGASVDETKKNKKPYSPDGIMMKVDNNFKNTYIYWSLVEFNVRIFACYFIYCSGIEHI